MSEKIINTREYWNKRFDTDWNEYGGNQQTEFFAKIACDMFPEWFVRDIKLNQYTLCDIGCALGDGVDILSKFLGIRASGMDFSEEAINKAKERYPQYEFYTDDVINLSEVKIYDIIYCSNVLEHFPNPWDIANNLSKISSHYIVLLFPFREKLNISEHVYNFDTNLIPLEINKFKLIHVNTVNGEEIENSFYPDQQIFLIYSNIETDIKLANLKDISNGITYADLKDSLREINKLQDENYSLQNQINEFSKQIEVIRNENTNNIENFNKQIELLEFKIQNLQKQIVEYSEREKELKNQLTNFENLEKELNDLKSRKSYYANLEDNLRNEIEQLRKYENEREEIIKKALNQCKSMTYSRLFKLVHFLNRFLYQGIKGTKLERKKFRKWLYSHLVGGGDADHRFHPLFSIINILESYSMEASTTSVISNKSISLHSDIDCELTLHLRNEENRLKSKSKKKSKEVYKIEEIINSRAYKGILIYPHVVYWEPLQTPQQLLRAFAKQGWICFFCEHPNVKDCFREIEPNLYITHEKDLLEAIGNKQVTILLTWLGSLSFVNQINNKIIWYHILDKLEIFPYYNQTYLDLHNQAVKTADYVSYVAKPLLNCIENKNDAIYLPNGTNPDELLNQHDGFIPNDMINIVNTGHKIIGYYGYLADWMDYELVADVAKARPNYEFVFIGKAIHDTSKIDKLPNVHLLGLKPYNELSDYAKLFDVATIPFVINDMMDCVSPIKFYEYCALGLPVITSRMKEMESFVREYVACFNDRDEYLFYLDKFVQREIRKLAVQQAPFIAKENTWISRAKRMIEQFDRNQQTILSQDYVKFDIIIMSVIDYDFRYQRPQHLASRFAKNGHRVFYINANHYKESCVTEIEENLFIINLKNVDFSAIHLTDWEYQQAELQKYLDNILYQYCIRDAVSIVDYPNWVLAAQYLKTKFGFKIITDYMDDYTGFLNPAEKLVGSNCVKLLELSDMVITSSQFLYDIAKKYNTNIAIVRNGTEFKHFYTSYINMQKRQRKVVGYYGAVAQWFDINKVCYLAENLNDCDIVIIGEVTEGRNKLQKYENIKLLGEMSYNELPKHLAYFDVCLIPFDTSTDLIKATNPVKFYEYLSAGKKVVATEIPELEPYKDKYVYMANDNNKFLNYVKLCLEGNDTLADSQECIEFGKSNDWQVRYESFSSLCLKAVPKISVIVLTYNNLELNKLCINSILNKTAYPNYELIIVDNKSSDGTIDYLNQLTNQNISNVKIILNEANSGFAGGNNIGIKASTGDYVLLLNNDTLVTRGWLTSLVKHLENDKKLGMCGPVTNSIGNEAKIKVLYNSINEMESFAYNYTWDNMGKQYKDPNILALFCTLIKREVIDKCGILNEEYGVGMFEDDDYAEAVKNVGYKLTIAEDAFIHHFEGASFKKLDDVKFRKIFEENKEIFEKKWNKKWKVHEKREGITWDTNIDINILD